MIFIFPFTSIRTTTTTIGTMTAATCSSVVIRAWAAAVAVAVATSCQLDVVIRCHCHRHSVAVDWAAAHWEAAAAALAALSRCLAVAHLHAREMEWVASGKTFYPINSTTPKDTHINRLRFFSFHYSNYEDFSRDSFDDRRPTRDSFDLDRRPGMRGPSPLRYAPYW